MIANIAIAQPVGHARHHDVTVAHSISSTVLLDHRREIAHKTYSPPRWVRVLYRAAFQAPFPYESNPDAIAAAAARRKIAGMLTAYWFGCDLVAPVVDVHEEDDGSYGFVTQLVKGDAPWDRRHARRYLRQITSKFLAAGLPTWQVTPYNPRAVGNLIAARDGIYRIIDLESNLVAPLMPVTGIVGLIRQGTFPLFDDIDVAKLNRYLARERDAIVAEMGQDPYDEMLATAAAYAAAAKRWHDSEARVLSRSLRFALRVIDVPSWIRAARRPVARTGNV